MLKTMYPCMKYLFYLSIVLLTGCKQETTGKPQPGATGEVSDPLPSWNDGQVKRSIKTFVAKCTDSSSDTFVPLVHRIATFDNDGTLWAEKPYVQELFALYRAKQMVNENPELAKKQPFMAVLNQDKEWFAKGGEKALLQLVAVTHTGMIEDEFERSVNQFFRDVKYPGREVTIDKVVYLPQLELLNYLRANGFKI